NGGMDALEGASLTALSPANGHLSYLDCRSSHAPAELQVIPGGIDGLQHLAQVAGDSHFAYGIGQLAVADPKSRRASRVVAGHNIDPEAHQLRDVESIGHAGDDFLRRLDAGFQKEVPVSDPRVAG